MPISANKTALNCAAIFLKKIVKLAIEIIPTLFSSERILPNDVWSAELSLCPERVSLSIPRGTSLTMCQVDPNGILSCRSTFLSERKVVNDPCAVTLQQMLDARDARVAYQQQLLQQFSKPLLSITLVMPGEIKSNGVSQRLAYWLQQALDDLIAKNQWKILFSQIRELPTGFEQFIIFDISAKELKTALIALEQQHPLGRLWDLDVIDVDGQSLSRQQLGFPARRCLICDQDAHGCGRSRRHSLHELQAYIGNKVEQYEQSQTSKTVDNSTG